MAKGGVVGMTVLVGDAGTDQDGVWLDGSDELGGTTVLGTVVRSSQHVALQ